jgi:predicted lipid-binding transport protein (Tim44 family)
LFFDEAFDPSLLIFAALAVFVLWKLHSVLGMRSERDAPVPPGRFSLQARALRARAPIAQATPSDVRASADPDRWQGLAEKGGKAWAGLDAVAAADPSFSGPAFIEGARKAYEMIVTAFGKGDRETLRRLLSAEVFDRFTSEISDREARGETVETAVVSIDSATIEDARAQPQGNSLTVRFVAKMMTARRKPDGGVIEGGLEPPASIVDLWTFARDPRAKDPNWKLVATESVQ